jgi:uncharacterized protein (TIGR00251 family)
LPVGTLDDVDESWIRTHEDGVTVTVWAVPAARRTEIVGRYGDSIRVRVAAPPEGGRANREIADLLQRRTGSTRISLVRGATSRRKVFLLPGVAADDVVTALGMDHK